MVGIAIVTALSAVTLKKYAPETAVVIAIAGSVIMMMWVLGKMTPIIGEIQTCIEKAGIDADYPTILLKSVGICLVCQFTADSCRDAGQSSIASKVELCAGISILVLSLPLIEQILSLATGLLISE